MIKTKDVVELPHCGLYVKTPEALKPLLKELGEKNYEIIKNRNQKKEKRVIQYSWYAKHKREITNEEDLIDSLLNGPHAFSIYEAWRWAPLKPSYNLYAKIISAAGLIPDLSSYPQNGHTLVHKLHVERMRIFVENLTTINIKEWDNMITHAPKNYFGTIKAIIAFCQKE